MAKENYNLWRKDPVSFVEYWTNEPRPETGTDSWVKENFENALDALEEKISSAMVDLTMHVTKALGARYS